jgi:hypothetical protein
MVVTYDANYDPNVDNMSMVSSVKENEPAFISAKM